MALRAPTAFEVHEVLGSFELPERFLIGCATAGYQCEGGYNQGDGPRNNWAEWETRPGNERTGVAARFWDRPETDFDLAAKMGLNAFRLSVEWARTQPVRERKRLETAPPLDEAAVGRYVEILLAARARGLEPVVTLHHFTHPWWVGLDPWLTDEGVDRFIDWVRLIVPALNERLLAAGSRPIEWFVTINEPDTLAPGTYLSRWMPSATTPNLGGPARMAACFDGLHAAHVRAYGAIHRWYADKGLPRPKVTINNIALDFYGPDRFFTDLLLSRSRGLKPGPALDSDLAARADSWHKRLRGLTGLSRRAAPQRWLAAHGVRLMGGRFFRAARFPRTLKALAECDWERPLDVLSFDYYDATLANQLKLATGGYDPWDWEAVPEGFYDLLLANANDGLEVLVAENGMGTRRPLGAGPAPRADGVKRADFVRAHIFHLLRAMRDGAKVAGYLHWSIVDNYEWGRYAPRFGLHAVDFSDEERPRLAVDASGEDSATAYGAIAKALRARDKAALEAALVGEDQGAAEAAAFTGS